MSVGTALSLTELGSNVCGGTCAATDQRCARQATADIPALALVGTAEIVFKICEAIW